MSGGMYAKGTKVSVEASEMEIRRLLIKYGADQFGSGWDGEKNIAGIHFRIKERQVRMILPLPALEDFKRSRAGANQAASWTASEAQRKSHEQATKERWRALVLIVKAKLEAVDAGISTIEREFFSDIVLYDGETMFEKYKPQIEQMYATGQMPSPIAGLIGPGGKP